MCVQLCTTAVHNTAQKSSDNVSYYPPPTHTHTVIIAQILSIEMEWNPTQKLSMQESPGLSPKPAQLRAAGTPTLVWTRCQSTSCIRSKRTRRSSAHFFLDAKRGTPTNDRQKVRPTPNALPPSNRQNKIAGQNIQHGGSVWLSDQWDRGHDTSCATPLVRPRRILMHG